MAASLYRKMFGVFIAVILATVVTAQEPEYFLTNPVHTIRERDSGGELAVQVSRTGTGDGFVRLRISQTGANPATTDDIDPSDVSLTFTGTEPSENAAIAIRDDNVYEGVDETFTITLTIIDGSPGTVRAGSDTAVVTIQDNDSLFYIDEDESDVVVTEDALVATFTIKRITSYDTQTATVSFSTDEVSNADEGSDYVRVNNKLITFGQGVVSQTADVEIINDMDIDAATERFDVVLSNPTNGQLGSPSSVDVSILNDDGVYSFTQSAYGIGESAGSVEVCVQRTPENTIQPRDVLLTTANQGSNTATANVDYTALTTNTGTLSFGVGDNLECVDINISGDDSVEPAEFFLVQISEAQGEIGSPSEATVTITDDDASFQFTQSSRSISEGAGTVAISLQRNGYLQTIGSVRVTSSPVSASSSVDYSPVNEVVSFTSSINGIATGTVTITIVSDNLDEFDETIQLDLVDPSGGSIGSPSQMLITIVDDDDDSVAPASGDGGGGSGDLSPAAIGGIIAGAVVGALALLALLLCACCMMRCPCCPGLYDRFLAGRNRGRRTVVVDKPQPRFVEPAPVYQLEQAFPVIQNVPQLGWMDNGLPSIDQYNNQVLQAF